MRSGCMVPLPSVVNAYCWGWVRYISYMLIQCLKKKKKNLGYFIIIRSKRVKMMGNNRLLWNIYDHLPKKDVGWQFLLFFLFGQGSVIEVSFFFVGDQRLAFELFLTPCLRLNFLHWHIPVQLRGSDAPDGELVEARCSETARLFGSWPFGPVSSSRTLVVMSAC